MIKVKSFVQEILYINFIPKINNAYENIDKAVNKFLSDHESRRNLIRFRDKIFSDHIIRVITYEELVGKLE